MDLVVRPAEEADLESAHEVWHCANVARNLTPSPERIEQVRQKLADPTSNVLVAARGDEVVGMLVAVPGRTDSGRPIAGLAHISMVFVRPDSQGQGVGTGLLQHLIPIAKSNGWSRLSLWTRQTNESARRLYQREDFTLTGESKLLDESDLIDRWQRQLQRGRVSRSAAA